MLSRQALLPIFPRGTEFLLSTLLLEPLICDTMRTTDFHSFRVLYHLEIWYNSKLILSRGETRYMYIVHAYFPPSPEHILCTDKERNYSNGIFSAFRRVSLYYRLFVRLNGNLHMEAYYHIELLKLIHV